MSLKKKNQLTCRRSGGRGRGVVLVAVVLVGPRYLGLRDARRRGLGLLLGPALQGQDAMMQRRSQLTYVLRATLKVMRRTATGCSATRQPFSISQVCNRREECNSLILRTL